jgi:hypothetical protein
VEKKRDAFRQLSHCQTFHRQDHFAKNCFAADDHHLAWQENLGLELGKEIIIGLGLE